MPEQEAHPRQGDVPKSLRPRSPKQGGRPKGAKNKESIHRPGRPRKIVLGRSGRQSIGGYVFRDTPADQPLAVGTLTIEFYGDGRYGFTGWMESRPDMAYAYTQTDVLRVRNSHIMLIFLRRFIADIEAKRVMLKRRKETQDAKKADNETDMDNTDTEQKEPNDA